MVALNFCHLKSMPILQQLQLEEALLRAGNGNWCLVNEGSPPAIVMGISGKAEELIDSKKVAEYSLPIIRRFSGGGTVLIEENTLFVTFLFERQSLDLGSNPQAYLNWTEAIYQPVFSHTPFCIRENDYCLADRKCGGNAQYIAKQKWLHHTSFLWDFCPEKMQVLKMPKVRPQYREARAHTDFLTPMKPFFDSKEQFFDALFSSLSRQFALTIVAPETITPFQKQEHRKSVKIYVIQ